MKNIWKSKTVYLNLVTLLIGVITLTGGVAEFSALAPYLVFANGVLNLVLRIFFTTEAITTSDV